MLIFKTTIMFMHLKACAPTPIIAGSVIESAKELAIFISKFADSTADYIKVGRLLLFLIVVKIQPTQQSSFQTASNYALCTSFMPQGRWLNLQDEVPICSSGT